MILSMIPTPGGREQHIAIISITDSEQQGLLMLLCLGYSIYFHSLVQHGVMATLTPFAEVQVAPMLSVHGSVSRLSTTENAC